MNNNSITKFNETEEYILKGVIKGIQNTIDRYKNIEDPVLKNMLILDKVLSLLDFSSGLIEVGIDKKVNDPELGSSVKRTFKDVLQLFRELSDHVMSPSYSPDHPYGKNLMNMSLNNFNEKKEKK